MNVLKAHLNKAWILLKNNYRFIIWLIFFFSVSCEMLSKNRLISDRTAFFICLVCYAVSITVALLFGEPVLKAVNGARPVETLEEKEYIIPIFESAVEKARKKYPDLPMVKPFIIDTIAINAMAIGKHTVAVTKGAVSVFSEEQLEAIILHEIAHIYYKDTQKAIINTVANGFLSFYIISVDIFFTVLDLLFIDLDDSDTKHFSGLLRILFAFLRMMISLTVQTVLFIGNVLLAGNSRKSEFEADKFSYDLGCGNDIIEALYLLQKISFSEKTNLIEKMLQNHPRISKRIAKLEEMQEKELLQETAS